MDRPAIVIRDIHHYGDDLTVPEAIARLCDGGQVTVTVTDPAPPGGDPRGNPRHGFDITVRPALGGQPELPPEISWEARTFETPDSAALFAEALALASQLAACGRPRRLRPAAPSGPPTGGRRPARPRPRHARRLPRHHPCCEAGDHGRDLYDTPALGGQHGIRYARGPGRRPRPPLDGDLDPALADDSVLRRPRRRTSPPPAKPSGPRPGASPATAPPSTPAPAASAARHEPPAGRKPGHPGPHREN